MKHPVVWLAGAALCVGCAQDPSGPPIAPEALIAFSVRLPLPDSMPIYVVRSDGTGPHRIVHGPGTRYGVTWAPSREQLAYIHSPTGANTDGSLRLVNVDGSNDHAILGPGRLFSPAWAPDGRSLLVTEQDSLGAYRLRKVLTNGGAATFIGPDSLDFLDAAWSPDGQRIAFVSNCHGAPPCNSAVTDLWVMQADGSGRKQLTNGVAIDDDAGHPTWSPDGTWLAFQMSRGGETNIYRIRPAGTGLTQLTFETALTPALSPSYSPDGTRLLFTRWLGPDPVTTPLYILSPDAAGAVDSLGLTVGEPVGATWAR